MQGVRLRLKRRGPEIWACGMGRGITARITAVIREAVERGREEDGGADEQAHADSETGEDRGRRACGGMACCAGPCASRAERLPGLGTGVGCAGRGAGPRTGERAGSALE